MRFGHTVMSGLLMLGVACANDPVSPIGGTTPSVGETTGDWLPSVGGNATYTVQTGRYSRIGDHVWVTGTIQIATLGTGSATQITGLPFTSIDGQEPSGVVGYYKDLNQAFSTLTVTVRPDSKDLAFHATLGSDTRMVTVSPLKDGSLIYFSVSYEAKP